MQLSHALYGSNVFQTFVTDNTEEGKFQQILYLTLVPALRLSRHV